MISAVSLRLLYLIFQHMLGLLLLMGRTSSTKDIELLVQRHEVARGIGHHAAVRQLGNRGNPATATRCCPNLSTATTLTARAPVTRQLPTGRTPPPQRPSGRHDETDSAVSYTSTCCRMT